MKKCERTLCFKVLVIWLCVFSLSMSLSLIFPYKNDIEKSQNVDYPNISIWEEDGIPICVLEQDQKDTHIVKDGAGGAIIVWMDNRSGNYDIYAQRIDADGNIKWTENGIPVCINSYEKYQMEVQYDNFGGAFITWAVEIGGYEDVYAQRIDGNGNLLWGSEAVPVCTDGEKQRFPTLCRDKDNGTIIAWSDWRNPSVDIYAQRLNASGDPQWNENGIIICDAIGGQLVFDICIDGDGGAIIVWEDQRNGLKREIYSQRINSSGIEQWDANGKAICTEIDNQFSPTVINNGTHGAFIGWYDNRSSNYDIYVQYINSTGGIQWKNNGTEICTEIRDQSSVLMCDDNDGGIILAWQDERYSAGPYHYDLFTQRLNASGDIQWNDNGTAFCVHDDTKYLNSICSGGSEGVILTWEDERNEYGFDLYAQKMDNDGNILWDANGISVCSSFSSQFDLVVCPDDTGGGFFSWMDWRYPDNDRDIYALRFNASGSIPSIIIDNGQQKGGNSITDDDDNDNTVASGRIPAYNFFIIFASIIGVIVAMIIRTKNKKIKIFN